MSAPLPGDRWDVCGRCTHYRLEHLDRRGPGRRCAHLDPDVADDTDRHDPCPCPGFRPRTNASPTATRTSGRLR